MGPQAMEGNLTVKPGDLLLAGYDFTIPGAHAAATVSVSGAKVTFQGKCVTGGALVTLIAPIINLSITDPAGSPSWYPTGDQKSLLAYQGAVLVGNACGNNSAISLSKGGTFTASLSSTTHAKINFRWHYSANGSSGSWSATTGFTP
jgi:hypothetical protein